MIDTEELRRKLRSADLIDHIDIHANVKSTLAELMDRLEAAEKERDALQAKIERIEKQEPVAFGLYSGWALKATYLKYHEACEQRDRRQLTADLSGSLEAYRVVPLYALPGAKGE